MSTKIPLSFNSKKTNFVGINSSEDIEKYIEMREEEMNNLLKSCFDVQKNDISELDLVMKFEEFYDQLYNKYLENKKTINFVEGKINNLSTLISNKEYYVTILNNKKNNTNKIVDSANRTVDEIKGLEVSLFNKRIKELDNMKLNRYDNLEHQLKSIEVQQSLKINDKEMNIIRNSMNLLKKWSNKNTFNIVFDSKIDGDGSCNMLRNKLMDKSNLYFITFDDNDNIYGGFISNTKNIFDCSTDDYTQNIDEFAFSLNENGKLESIKYSIVEGFNYNMFTISNFSSNGELYGFSYGDIVVFKAFSNESYNGYDLFCWYDFRDDQQLEKITQNK